MSERRLVKSFESFKGLDFKSVGITTEDGPYATQLYNVVRGRTFAIRSRYGLQWIGQPGGFLGMKAWSYFDPITGNTKQKFIAINDRLWRLESSSFTVAKVAGGNYGYSFLPNPNSTTSPRNTFLLNQSGVYLTVQATGTPTSTFTNIYDLFTAIDGTANFNCTITSGVKFAKVNGNQTSSTNMTILAGHTYNVTDYVIFINGATNKLEKRLITATTGTTLTVEDWGSFTIFDGQILGPYAAPMTSIPFTEDFQNNPTLISFNYWEEVADCNGLNAPFGSFYASYAADSTTTPYQPPVVVNTPKKAYIFTKANQNTLTSNQNFEGYPHYYDGQTVARAGVPKMSPGTFSVAQTAAAGGLVVGSTYKYKLFWTCETPNGDFIEGQPTLEASVTLTAGNDSVIITVPHPGKSQVDLQLTLTAATIGTNTFTVASTAGVKSGDRVTFMDTTGAPPNKLAERKVTSVTATTIVFDGVAANLGAGLTIGINAQRGFNLRGATINGASAGNVLTVVTGHTIRPGDSILFYNDSMSELVRNVVSTTATTITFDGDPAPVGATAVTAKLAVTNRFYFVVYRTKGGGNVFYRVPSLASANSPLLKNNFNYSFSTTATTDKATDAQLLEQLIEPVIGKERDLPPRASLGCLHQGGMAYSGIPDQQNTFAFSSLADGYEAVPLALNYADISSEQEGQIVGIVSDTEDRLSLFKEAAYAEASGSLDDNAFTIKNLREGDFGVSSQASIQKIKGINIGVGPLGLVQFSSGESDDESADSINAVIEQDDTKKLKRAVSCTDITNTSYKITIPSPNIVPSQATNESFCFDYKSKRWSTFGAAASFNIRCDSRFGMAVYKNRFYQLSQQNNGSLFGETNPSTVASVNGLSAGAGTRVLYCDTGLLGPISIFATEWQHLGEPSLDKIFLRFKIFRKIESFEQDEVPPDATYQIISYSNYNESTPIGRSVVTFTNYSDYEQFVLIPSRKARSMKFVVTNDLTGSSAAASWTTVSPLYLTGYEITVSTGYTVFEPTRDRSPSS